MAQPAVGVILHGSIVGLCTAGATVKRSQTVMHYPHKVSKVKRRRKIGFLARMRTKKGRQMINRKRRAGRKINVV